MIDKGRAKILNLLEVRACTVRGEKGNPLTLKKNP